VYLRLTKRKKSSVDVLAIWSIELGENIVKRSL
jgi:hypothetical protein